MGVCLLYFFWVFDREEVTVWAVNGLGRWEVCWDGFNLGQMLRGVEISTGDSDKLCFGSF